MKISTKSRYGLRIMRYLAQNHNSEPVKLGDMAKNENLSEKYLEQIIISLKAANLVKSVRGANGGYFLSKKPDQQSVLEIIEKLEGPLHFVNCVEDHTLCERSKDCVTRKLW
ncbi:MAG: AsnC family transcriptional regulator, partial [Spirochaetae bacterium HGW-Spirochaetae-6]